MRKRSKVLVWSVVLLLVVSACSSEVSGTFSDIAAGLSNGGEMPALSGEERASTEQPDVDVDQPQASNDLGDGAIAAEVFQVATIGRDIIFVAEMKVAVADVGQATAEATRVIARHGGFLFGQHTTGGNDPVSTLTFKIPPDQFQQALVDLGSLGEVRTQNVTASDVTDRIVDLESRIATAAASVDRLRALLSDATDIKEVVALEAELLARETTLESLRGQLRTLQDQVALATISVTIDRAAAHPELSVIVTGYPGHNDGAGCPGEGEGVDIEENTDATLCYEIRNAGDTLLTSFEIRDPVLDLGIDEMTVVFGDLSEPLEPGATVLLATELTVERDLRTQTTVTATPVNEDGSEIAGQKATRTSSFFVSAFEPGGIPSFTEGLQASWNWLVGLGQLVLLAAGAFLPFIWVPLLAWFLLNRLRGGRSEAADEES